MTSPTARKFHTYKIGSFDPVTDTHLPPLSEMVPERFTPGAFISPGEEFGGYFGEHNDRKQSQGAEPETCIVEAARKVWSMSSGRRAALEYILHRAKSLVVVSGAPGESEAVKSWRGPNSHYNSKGYGARVKNGMKALASDGYVQLSGEDGESDYGIKSSLNIVRITVAVLQLAWVGKHYTKPIRKVTESPEDLAKKIGKIPDSVRYTIEVVNEMLFRAERGKSFDQCRTDIPVYVGTDGRKRTPALVGLERRGLLVLDRDDCGQFRRDVTIPRNAAIVKVALKLQPSLIERYIAAAPDWGTM